jgi:predicted AAA+ superfamily ATPase
MSEKFIRRESQLNWLREFKEKPFIKVVTGVRRCGKSTLFKLCIEELLASGVKPEQILSVNLEELENENLLQYRALYDYLKAHLYPDGYTYIFLDEVQQCAEYEKAVDSLYIKDNVDIYITGSNAYMLSGELATLLSGRYVEIEMLPFSYQEYVQAIGADANSTATFWDYLRFGGFPAATLLEGKESMIRSYLDGIYSTILVKDVAKRLGDPDVGILEAVGKFLFSNVGSPVSVKKIADTLGAAGRSISVNTVGKYVNALCNSFLFYKIDRYDVRGRQHLKTNGKYYAVDSGLRNFLLASSTPDIGHVLENVVCLELLRRGEKVSIGKVAQKEVDFVCEHADGLTYYQVAASVLDENTLQRELAPLREIRDNHPKILLTIDDIPRSANYDGIRQMNVVDWLTGKAQKMSRA